MQICKRRAQSQRIEASVARKYAAKKYTAKERVEVHGAAAATKGCGDAATAGCGDAATAGCGDSATAGCCDAATAGCGDDNGP